ncbi:hypothetical protein CRG98_046399, partial [Punica granatum]
MQPKRGKLLAPHFGPPAPHARIPDRSPGHYSSPGNRKPIGGHECQSDQPDVRAHFRGILLKSGHPDPPQTPFLTELPGFAPLTSKRPLKTGLQAPRDHQGRGTSFGQPSGTRLGLPRYVSVVANASRRAF